MYAENSRRGNRHDIFKNPCHPYTIGLLHSIPRLDIEQENLIQYQAWSPILHNFPKDVGSETAVPLKMSNV